MCICICRAEPLKHARSANKRKAILGLEKKVWIIASSVQVAGGAFSSYNDGLVYVV
jgi:hypothetical protein